MNVVLTEILRSQTVNDENGNVSALHSSIDRAEINFISKIIIQEKLVKSIEIGCANGISSLAICEAISNNSPDAKHVIIDAFQKSEWQNIGLNNLLKAGFNNYSLLEERSEYILPKLAEQGNRYDFAFIDGWHTFDHTLIDFFYLNRMLNVGGILVVDDLHMPAINKAARYMHTYPCYKYVDSVTLKKSKLRNFISLIQSIGRPLAKVAGSKLASEFFSPNILNTHKSLRLNASMLAFKKISEDERPWNWYADF